MAAPIKSEYAFHKYFWSKVYKTESCWHWIGAKTKAGYGIVQWNMKKMYCHRYVMEQLGHDLTNKVVLHKCDNPKCVNPDHLVVGTDTDNVADKVSKGRCPKGDTYSSPKIAEADLYKVFLMTPVTRKT